MKNQLLTQRVISEEVYRNIIIPKADIEKYYNEHKTEFVREEMVSLREILVSAGDGSPEKVAAAEKKAKGLVDRARKGEAKFTDLARQYSDAPTATNDGELGAFKRGDLAKEIDDIVFKQHKGYVTDPIRRPAGLKSTASKNTMPPGRQASTKCRARSTASLMRTDREARSCANI